MPAKQPWGGQFVDSSATTENNNKPAFPPFHMSSLDESDKRSISWFQDQYPGFKRNPRMSFNSLLPVTTPIPTLHVALGNQRHIAFEYACAL